jgi:hypothetical protein
VDSVGTKGVAAGRASWIPEVAAGLASWIPKVAAAADLPKVTL